MTQLSVLCTEFSTEFSMDLVGERRALYLKSSSVSSFIIRETVHIFVKSKHAEVEVHGGTSDI